jgi:hypothetical protein
VTVLTVKVVLLDSPVDVRTSREVLAKPEAREPDNRDRHDSTAASPHRRMAASPHRRIAALLRTIA